MSKNTIDPARKLLAEFEAGRISRRQFLAAFSALAGAAALGAVPALPRAPRHAPVTQAASAPAPGD